MLPILQVGPLAIQTPGLILLLGVWLGLTLAERHATRYKVNPNWLYNLAFTAIIAGIVGARLTYIARFPSAFAASPSSAFSINLALFDPAGGVVLGALAALIYGQRKQMALLPTLDSLVPALTVMGIALGLAHLAAGTAYGAVTSLPWGIELWGARRHPSQVYETVAAVAILWVVWPGKGRFGLMRPGAQFALFLTLTAGARLLLEGFRGDSATLPNGIRVAQIVSWLILALGLWLLVRLRTPANQRAR